MQTFLPYPDFKKSLQTLDYRRLGKQRVEAYQIIRVLKAALPSKAYRGSAEEAAQSYSIISRGADDKANKAGQMNTKRPGGWRNHPAVKMWRGHINALKLYHNLCIDEWMQRGYQNRMQKMKISGRISYPSWFGREDFHAAHRSNLLRKDGAFYSRYGWTEPPDLPYQWG